MSLRSEALPNKALTGREILEITVQNFRSMLERDCMMSEGISYKRVAISYQVTFHLGQPHQPHIVRSYTKAAGVVEGEVPLSERCQCGHAQEDHGESGACSYVADGGHLCPCRGWIEDTVLMSLERDIILDNPNLARIHHDLPITVQERGQPKPMAMTTVPGEPNGFINDPFPSVETRELRYDKNQYDAPPPPVDRDVSEAKAGALGLKPRSPVKDRSKQS